MNLTDKEVNRFRAVVNGLLEELPKLVLHEDINLPLNNRKYTYSYTQYPNEVYVSKRALSLSDSDLDAILNSISSKERFVNLYITLCLVVQTNAFLEWGD